LAAIYLPKLCLDLEIFYLKFYEQNDSFETENLMLPTLICSYFAHLTLPFQACEKFLLFENFLPIFLCLAFLKVTFTGPILFITKEQAGIAILSWAPNVRLKKYSKIGEV